MDSLPNPTTVAEMYAAAILAELRALRSLLSLPGGTLQADVVRSSVKVADPELIVLREPEKVVKRRKR